MGNDSKFLYNDLAQRYGKMNRLYILAASCIWIIFFCYLMLKLMSKSITAVTAIGNIALVVIFVVANIIIHFKNKSGSTLKIAVALEVVLEFLLLGMQTDAEFIYFVILGILALQIPYYDQKVYGKLCICYTAIYTAVIIIRVVKDAASIDVDSIIRMVCIYMMLFVLYKVGATTKLFSDHALGAVAEQNSKQKVILENILDVSKTVHEESDKSGTLVDELVTVTENVANSMEEISSATNMTAQSIEEQNNMTHVIQRAITETAERSRKTVDIAGESHDSIEENLRVMEELKKQSERIALTNTEVSGAMEKLQDKTKEVENIAGMILQISNQTNLLALNASIESARAGEAGRGFAVVAEQIRQLAEQTRSSTEQISKILGELNENAGEVVESVKTTIIENNSQGEKIIKAAESFERLNENMGQLIDNVAVINSQIEDLSDSNNKIVENISQLSAVTEEVTASAEQVLEKSNHNLEYAENVKTAIFTIRDKADGMKQYI
ncbi:MAG: methyl-accepting chemotaxis protein [Lachnospiraceae bacterium]